LSKIVNLCGILLFFISLSGEARETKDEKEQKARLLREFILEIDLGYLQCQQKCNLKELHEKMSQKWSTLKIYLPPQQKIEAIFLAKADPILWRQARKILETELFTNFSPSLTPNIQRGKLLYSVHCAACHGDSGKSNGTLSSRFPNSIRPLNDSFYRDYLSAGMIYNFLLTGIPGKPMYSFVDQLGNQDLWDLAFFTLTLSADLPSLNGESAGITDEKSEHSPKKDRVESFSPNANFIELVKTVRLQDLASYNGKELRALGFSEVDISSLRRDWTFRLEIKK